MIDRDRLQERLDAVGLSQSELARRVGIAQGTIAGLFTGRQQGSKYLHQIARELRTSPAYLTRETNDPSEGALPVPTAEDVADDLGLVALKEIDLSLGAGATYLGEAAVSETPRYFPRAWLREFTDAPPHMLVCARVRGDSMKPTIDDRAIAVIDLRRQRIDEQDVIWAIAVAEIGMVKRIWAQPDGSYKIKSDNPNVDPEIAVDGEMFVIGRVVGSLGRH